VPADVERPVEGLVLELDVMEGKGSRHPGEERLAADRERGTRGSDRHDRAVEPRVRAAGPALGVCRLVVVPVVERAEIEALPYPRENVLHAPPVTLLEQREGLAEQTERVLERVREAQLPSHRLEPEPAPLGR